MYVIQNESGLYFAGVSYGWTIWKGHWTRAITYNTERGAQKDISYCDLKDCR